MKKIIIIIILILLLLPTFVVNASAYDFSIDRNMQIKYEVDNRYVEITTEYLRRVLNSNYYFPAEGQNSFFIPDLSSQSEDEIKQEREFKKESIKVKDVNGNSVSFSIEEEESGIMINVPNYRQTSRNSPFRIFVTYKTHDYVKVVGNSVIIQGPALPEDVEFSIEHEQSNTKTKVGFNLDILIDDSVEPLAKIWPSGYNFSEEDNFLKYTFPSETRTGQNPYLEFGLSQIYRFEYKYIAPKTSSPLSERYSELFGSLYRNIIEISLPRFFDETNQISKIEEISPKPTKIGRDSEGNIIATFEVDSTKETEIIISGYIWLEQEAYESRKDIPNPTLNEYLNQIRGDSLLESYLSPTRYWQSDSKEIREEAERLKERNNSLLDLIKDNYRFVVDSLEYDYEKAISFNDRLGAVNALKIGSGVCMEYADLMIALFRAQGIPSRAAVGYANLSDYQNVSDDPQVRHQWVQVWVPNYGWLSIDPTWESENMDIGQNIHKVLWETFNGETLSNNKIFSADSLESISNIDFNISVFGVKEENIDNIDELKYYEELMPIEDIEQDESLRDWANKFFKASTLGRSVSIVIPIMVILIILIFAISIIRFFIKLAIRKRKN